VVNARGTELKLLLAGAFSAVLNYEFWPLRLICFNYYKGFFYVHVTVRRDRFPYNKTTRCTEFSNLFWNEILHVSDSSSVRHQELLTVHSAMVYVIQVCRQLSSRIRVFHPDPAAARKLSTNLYNIYHC
jgi:hypothetical protein